MEERTGIMVVGVGSKAPWFAYFLPDPAAPGLIPSVPNFFSVEKLSMLLRLINGAAKRIVDRGLKMLMKPIWCWLVAS